MASHTGRAESSPATAPASDRNGVKKPGTAAPGNTIATSIDPENAPYRRPTKAPSKAIADFLPKGKRTRNLIFFQYKDEIDQFSAWIASLPHEFRLIRVDWFCRTQNLKDKSPIF
ncbi:hypothetical protein [Aurantimonas sp. A3-2-R12]|uniref:hypothetical protein n=1 Tax=Aurantimonas sp. A3-2-R12 TaxID=3114362 RepID=UPI002E19608D|nr:hypothetical protein [Aurantimonas sp. A3-2-R12]